MSENARWYVVHTFSGYEKKVQTDIEKSVENRGLHDLIFEVQVPMEEVVEQKGDEQKIVQRKLLPGYVMVKMIMTDESWYVIRNTRGVTGFVGPGSKPVPLTEEEVHAMGIERRVVKVDFEVGASVRVTGGPFSDFVGVVSEINAEKQTVRVIVSMFGRETPVELDFSQIEVLD
ncbi:MAG: transcription termination/antitermination protein NusG [Clostridia bacterium]|nr:transcription termination/antitermination protein NusG [Clostridia bacterium]